MRRRAERSQKIGMPQKMGRAPERLEGVGDRRARERVLVEEAAGEEDALLAPPLRRVRPRQLIETYGEGEEEMDEMLKTTALEMDQLMAEM